MSLMDKTGEWLTVPTTCKSWSCLACRDRVKALFKQRIRHGCSILEPSYLITLTFKTVGDARRDAASVRVVWTQWLRSLKQRWPNLSWMRVIEATQKGQPHIHLVMGGLTTGLTASCTGKDNRGKPNHRFDMEWLWKKCICLEHICAQEWYKASQDSYVVDARQVLGAAGAAAYISKYLAKTLMSYSQLHMLGFTRRWTTSRNWPRLEGLQLVKSLNDEWVRTQFTSVRAGTSDALNSEVQRGKTSHMSQRTGTSADWDQNERSSKLKAKALIERGRNATIRP